MHINAPFVTMQQSDRYYIRSKPHGKHVAELAIAIDLGTDGTRASVLYNIDQVCSQTVLHHQFAEEGEEDHNGRHDDLGQFSSQFYPFLDGLDQDPDRPIYMGNAYYPDLLSTSAKFAFAPLVGIAENVARKYPMLASLDSLARSHPQRLRDGIIQLLERVIGQAKFVTDSFKRQDGTARRVDTLCLTIPAQWTLDFEDLYGDLALRAFERIYGYRDVNVLFFTEAQALMHVLFFTDNMQAFANRLGLQHVLKIGDKSNAFLVLDGGGHSMNTALVTICKDHNGVPCLLEIAPDQGCYAGTEVWAYEVLKKLKSRYYRQTKRAAPAATERLFHKQFHQNKTTFCHDSGYIFRETDPNASQVMVSVTGPEMQRAFDWAFREAFALIEDRVRLAVGMRTGACKEVKILVSGGSTKHRMFKARMKAICDKYGIGKDLVYLHKIELDDHAKHAVGANLAASKGVSVAEAFKTAAFGLQTNRTVIGKRGGVRWEWDDMAKLLLTQGRFEKVVENTLGNEEFKIVCQPMGANGVGVGAGDSQFAVNNLAYDLMHLPMLGTGRLGFTFMLDPQQDNVFLEVHRYPEQSSAAENGELVGTVGFDCWVPHGHRCIVIWQEQEEMEERVRRAFATRQHDRVTGRASGKTRNKRRIIAGLDVGPDNSDSVDSDAPLLAVSRKRRHASKQTESTDSMDEDENGVTDSHDSDTDSDAPLVAGKRKRRATATKQARRGAGAGQRATSAEDPNDTGDCIVVARPYHVVPNAKG